MLRNITNAFNISTWFIYSQNIDDNLLVNFVPFQKQQPISNKLSKISVLPEKFNTEVYKYFYGTDESSSDDELEFEKNDEINCYNFYDNAIYKNDGEFAFLYLDMIT